MGDAVITIRGLNKRFGTKEVLRGIDLDVAPGQVLGYLGPNGAGKSTTVKILIGTLDDFQGQVSVCGHDVRGDPLAVKRRIGYVPESAALYDALTPREYLRFLGRIYGVADAEIERRTREMLGLFDLASELDNRMTTFSKGMRQKVLITAGLLHNPEVLFLDEPLSGLDANSVVVVKEVITRLARAGKTVFYCSHVMDVVERVCDRIVIINDGHIVADGTFEQLQSQSKAASLERIFTQLTSSGGHEAVAERFIHAFGGASRSP
ncbi:MAG: ABC transporter ATP-binding protein NatA [Phycisphaerae bacterium]|nr:ABC transporter ATP-binding protein NatA [Phycisphaerae bacterium]